MSHSSTPGADGRSLHSRIGQSLRAWVPRRLREPKGINTAPAGGTPGALKISAPFAVTKTRMTRPMLNDSQGPEGRAVTVFCGSSAGKRPAYTNAAVCACPFLVLARAPQRWKARSLTFLV